jgi:hypothetical protein
MRQRRLERDLDDGLGAIVHRQDVDTVSQPAAEGFQQGDHAQHPEHAAGRFAAECAVAHHDGRPRHHQRQFRHGFAQLQLGHALGVGVAHRMLRNRRDLPGLVHMSVGQLAARHGRADLHEALEPLALGGQPAEFEHATHVGVPQRRMVGERRQRGAVDEDFRIAKLGGAGIAQVERDDLRFGNALQYRLRQLEAREVGAQACEAVGGGVTAHGKTRISQQTFGCQIGGNGAAHKTGCTGQQNTHA